MTAFQTVDKEAKARRVIIVIELYRMAKVTLAKTKSKNSVYRKVNIMFKPLLALFVFCSGAVPSYSSHSQNTKFISLSQSLPACRNL